MLSIDDIFDGNEIRQDYIPQVKLLLERENLSFEWQFFTEYQSDREGIRYHFEDGYIDWLIPSKIDDQHLYVSGQAMQAQVIQWLNIRFIG